MKRYLVFILLLVNSSIFACGFYPEGEDTRFSFFNPLNFHYHFYSNFNYSMHSFGQIEESSEEKNFIDDNEKLWIQYCSDKVSIEAIRTVLFEFKVEDISSKSSNQMLQYLYKTKNLEALNYLKFAKNCELLNGYYDDPWERNQITAKPKRAKLIEKAIALSNKTTDKNLKLRYTFLAIRLSYYNEDREKIRTLYDTVFKTQKEDILKYWSLYFRTFAEENKALSNFYAAQVFVNAPDKRFMIASKFDSKVPIDLVLKYAKTNQEKANVYFLAGLEKSDQSLYYIKQVYKYNPSFEGASFLLLREINKIEDWVLTPYYSLFSPSIEYDDEEEKSAKEILKRVEKDRIYASQLLEFVTKVDLKKTYDPLLWKMSKAYLAFITKDNQGCLNQISKLEKNISKKDPLYNQIQIIKALALTANQSAGKAVILDEVKPILLKNEKQKKFVFAIGRELEYKDNVVDAVFLYSKLNSNYSGDYSYNDEAYWKSSKAKINYYSDYYSDYFDYINMFYSPENVINAVEETIRNENGSDEFNVWKYADVKKEIPRLYDLIGTKYIRQNNLEKALFYFNKNEDKTADKIGKSDCLWEKENCESVSKNPFLVLKYTPDFVPQKDLFKLNKYEVTKKLILYLKKSVDPKEKNKDYYNFLIANCYYNMSFYGSLQEMRRYNWNIYVEDYPVEDNNEFYECNLAKKYYELAFKNAKTDKFKGLCLRMMGKCEKNRLEHRYRNDYDNPIKNYDNFLWNKNRYYQDLKSNYPNDYENLISDCSSFEEYFNARR